MKSKRLDIQGDPFGMKCKTRIGFWKVRTLTEYGKLKQVEMEDEVDRRECGEGQ